MSRLSGANALLQSLLVNDVDTIFGLPGGQLDHFFDAMYHESDRVQFVGSRHEQGAAYMAFGYAKSSGKVGTYTVVPGPGVLNSTAALCSAYANNSPVLCVTGQIPSEGIGSGIGYLHELPDQLATMKSLTKYAERIDHPSQTPQVINEAFRNLTTGRPRPVSIEMPMDVMGQETDVNLLGKFDAAEPTTPDLDAIDDAAKLIASSKNPMIVVGGGAVDASEELLEFASMVQAPVVSFRNGRGIISDRHYLGHTFASGYELWKETDLVIGIGSRMQAYLQEWQTDDEMKIIRIDIDPREINRIQKADIGICADASTALAALINALPKHLGTRESRQEELTTLKAKINDDIQVIQPQLSYLSAIREELPDDGYLVDEITQVGFASWYGFPIYEPRHLITCGYQGTLGYGFATALGVKVAHPDKPVISISGDGGFMFNVQELATAAQFNIGLVSIVFNNNKYQNVQRQQKEWFGGRLIYSDLQNPDFVSLAESFGIKGQRTDSPEGLRTLLKDALNRNEPCLIEVSVGDMAAPWKFIIREPARS